MPATHKVAAKNSIVKVFPLSMMVFNSMESDAKLSISPKYILFESPDLFLVAHFKENDQYIQIIAGDYTKIPGVSPQIMKAHQNLMVARTPGERRERFLAVLDAVDSHNRKLAGAALKQLGGKLKRDGKTPMQVEEELRKESKKLIAQISLAIKDVKRKLRSKECEATNLQEAELLAEFVRAQGEDSKAAVVNRILRKGQ